MTASTALASFPLASLVLAFWLVLGFSLLPGPAVVSNSPKFHLLLLAPPHHQRPLSSPQLLPQQSNIAARTGFFSPLNPRDRTPCLCVRPRRPLVECARTVSLTSVAFEAFPRNRLSSSSFEGCPFRPFLALISRLRRLFLSLSQPFNLNLSTSTLHLILSHRRCQGVIFHLHRRLHRRLHRLRLPVLSLALSLSRFVIRLSLLLLLLLPL